MDPSSTFIAGGLTAQLVILIMYLNKGFTEKVWKMDTPTASAMASFIIPMGHFVLIKWFGVDPFTFVATVAPAVTGAHP